jgi:hypothetical protein
MSAASHSTLRVLTAICAAAALVGPPAAQSQTAAASLKGVLEPVNYPEDLELTDVFFVTPEIGYVAGAAGTILKTTDSGASWTPLLGGDPLSEERAITQLVFVTPTAGWATQIASSTNLLRTTDGENWELIGTIPEHYDDLAFSSETERPRFFGPWVPRPTPHACTMPAAAGCAAPIFPLPATFAASSASSKPWVKSASRKRLHRTM